MHKVGESQCLSAFLRTAHHAVAEAQLALPAQLLLGKLGQSSLQLLTGDLRCHAVHVRSRGCRRRRGIGHFVRARGGVHDLFHGQTKRSGDHGLNLGEKALTHFRAAVIHLHTAVGIKMHQRAGLIEMGCRKRNAKLDGIE